MATRAWGGLCRQGTRCDGRQRGRQFGAARNARRGDALEAGPDRRAGRPGDRADPLHRQRFDAPAGGRGERGRRADPARTPDDRDPSRRSGYGPSARHRRRQQWHHPQHQGAQGGGHRHRRPCRECQLPADVRPAPDRGILRHRRHAVVRSGRQRRDRGDGGWRLAVGIFQSDRRIRHPPDQARHDWVPVQLSWGQMAARQCGVRARPRLRSDRRGLAGRNPGQHVGTSVLR